MSPNVVRGSETRRADRRLTGGGSLWRPAGFVALSQVYAESFFR